MKQRVIFVFLVLCLTVVNTKKAPAKHNIKDLGTDFYNTIDSISGPWVVLFGNPQCAWTNAFKIIYDPISEDVETYACNFGSVDCSLYPRICAHFGVTKYPDIRYFDGGQYSFVYSGDLSNWFSLHEYLTGDYKNHPRKQMPNRDTLFEEEETFEEAFYQIKTLVMEHKVLSYSVAGIFGLIAMMGAGFWITACCCYPTQKRSTVKPKKD